MFRAMQAEMVRGGSVFDRIYQTIRSDILTGRFAAGRRLEPAVLADQLNASLTPVRDALHRLAGERLIEQHPHEGFRLPWLTEPQLRDLYRWQQALLMLALGTQDEKDMPLETADDSSVLFIALAERSTLAELAPAVRQVLDRLGAVRALEPALMGATAADDRALCEAVLHGGKAGARREIRRHHRWRIMHVEALVRAVTAARTDG